VSERVIPAMSLWQPYASLVAAGLKPFETRDRRPPAHLVGARIAIHAALRKPQFGEITPAISAAMAARTGNRLWFESLPFGAVLCTAHLAAVFPAERVPADAFGDYTPGRWAWHLTDVAPLPAPVPAKGERMHGWLWAVPDGMVIDGA
jgi:activating signal cointegrator 1